MLLDGQSRLDLIISYYLSSATTKDAPYQRQTLSVITTAINIRFSMALRHL